MDCFPDYCLACDKQIDDGLYCSQACRLTDLEKGGSGPSSPLATMSTATTPFSPGSVHTGTNINNIFHLSPAFSWHDSTPLGHQRSFSTSSLRSSPQSQFAAPNSPANQTTSCPSTPHRLLSPSSSRSSLTSSMSVTHSQAAGYLSEEAKNELRGYFHSFEYTRERRRQSHPHIRHHMVSQENLRQTHAFADEEQ